MHAVTPHALVPGLAPDAVSERFARAAWTAIAEPGDRFAGLVVQLIGATPALSALIKKIDGAGLRQIVVDSGGDELAADDLSADNLQSAIDRWAPRVKSPDVVVALSQAARYETTLLVPGDPQWPGGFDDLGPHAPIAVWVRGNLSTLATLQSSIALVGARAATGYGEHVTMEASAGLVDRGYTIVSGAAYGIDGMAHRAALASSGQTIAFLAGGVDRFYPSGHDALLTRIVEKGAVISELPCGSSPTKWRFLQRNRLIAASSLATIVLEAGWRSGSLNTAGHASALGRPLGAVPGPVTSAASAGCHRLIREYDATCVTNTDQMAELAPLGDGTALWPGDPDPAGSASSPTSDMVRVIDALSTRAPRASHDIAARAGLSVAAVRAVLGALELEGTVAERERGWLRKNAT
ncbi:DNA-protecting protein DprA [Lacisediminihabitans sp. G11-30]|uniref:DNA-protecting protein DprA n=1 Tax=Lacisediminihabitans changchengi TaxID=2787634 RepID=A0A934SGC8_9MICO|nr:DNA-protecting protein DprA [Lacisediminihabitans changchengi]